MIGGGQWDATGEASPSRVDIAAVFGNHDFSTELQVPPSSVFLMICTRLDRRSTIFSQSLRVGFQGNYSRKRNPDDHRDPDSPLPGHPDIFDQTQSCQQLLASIGQDVC